LITESAYTDEKALLQALSGGDIQAFETLYHRYSVPVYQNLLKLLKSPEEAEELLQDIFLKVWDKRAALDIHSGFGNYLFAVSRNLVYDFFRKTQRDRHLHARIVSVAAEQYSHIEEKLLRYENENLLQQAVEHLPPVRQKVFRLCKIEGFSYEEVSRLLGISPSTISDHIVKATRSVKEFVHTHQDTTLLLLVALQGIY
jgi:RNA polymerase sigma-70 factor (ECF subfamily)